jgi:PAS domain S-box-containing protein
LRAETLASTVKQELLEVPMVHLVEVQRDGTSHPVSALSTAELSRRPSRPPDYESENRALIALAEELATAPDGILQKLAETALSLCRAHSAGLSLLEEGDLKKNFHWRAIAGAWSPHKGGGTPRNFGPCGTVLDRNVPLLFSHPERDFPYFGEVTPLLEDALLVPFYIKGEAVGTIWVVSHDDIRRFDAEDLRVLTNLGTFAGAAYQSHLALTEAQRIASIVDASADAIVSKTLNGTITTWNQGATHLFGYMAEEIIGQNISVLIPPDRQDEERAIIERIQHGERIEHYETIRRRKDGSLVLISLSVSPIKNNDGKIIGASKVAHDISERKQKEEHIASFLARLTTAPRTSCRWYRQPCVSPAAIRPMLSSRQSRDASMRSQTCIACWGRRTGLVSISTPWSRENCRRTPRKGNRAQTSMGRSCG